MPAVNITSTAIVQTDNYSALTDTRPIPTRKVSVIPPSSHTATGQPLAVRKTLRVCAYCRVSTDHEEQQSSYDAQVAYYTGYIQQNPEWRYAGVFADGGISGTSTKRREAFNRMIDACKAGKIDMIISKSISRFARNTVDCLTYIRQLKEWGIPVFFEKENINTMDSAGEFIITLLGSLAQEESRNISTNIKWSIEKQFEQGKMRVPFLYGYTKVNGNLVINPDTSKYVIRIFAMYMQGMSTTGIARRLNDSGVPTPRNGKRWDKSFVTNVLTNEKYTGDAILQKYYNPDFLTGKAKINNGEVKKYYVEGSHPAIVSKDVYYAVQDELKRRNVIEKKTGKTRGLGRDRVQSSPHSALQSPPQDGLVGRYSSKYALTETLVCGECGKPYRRQIWNAYNPPRNVWRCINRLEFGKRVCNHSPTLDEHVVERAVAKAIRAVAEDKDEILATMKRSMEQALVRRGGTRHDSSTAFDANIERLKDELFKTMELEAAGHITNSDMEIRVIDNDNASGSANVSASTSTSTDTYTNADIYTSRYIELSEQLRAVQTERDALVESQVEMDTLQEKLTALESEWKDLSSDSAGMYDDVTVRKMVERITVVSKEKMVVRFCAGMEMEVEMEMG